MILMLFYCDDYLIIVLFYSHINHILLRWIPILGFIYFPQVCIVHPQVLYTLIIFLYNIPSITKILVCAYFYGYVYCLCSVLGSKQRLLYSVLGVGYLSCNWKTSGYYSLILCLLHKFLLPLLIYRVSNSIFVLQRWKEK